MNESLEFDINYKKQYVINDPFILGKNELVLMILALSDAEIEESIDNLPLLIAKVDT